MIFANISISFPDRKGGSTVRCCRPWRWMASGKADLVVMGRQRLADPLFNDKCAQGRADEIRGCLRCMRCFPGQFEDVEGEMRMAMERGDPYRPFQEMHGCLCQASVFMTERSLAIKISLLQFDPVLLFCGSMWPGRIG